MAYGQNRGCEWAYGNGYEYVLLLDQDSIFESQEDIFKLKTFAKNHLEYSLIAPNVKKIYFNQENEKNFSDDLLYKNNVGERKFVISSGSLIRLRDYMNVGRFDEKLFIGQIDQDFCYKLHINQKKCFVVENIYMYQELGSGKTVNIIGKKIMIPNYNHIRYYYIFRNEWYLREKYGESYNKFKVELWKYLILILFEKNRMKKYYSILKAKRDYKTMFVQDIR